MYIHVCTCEHTYIHTKVIVLQTDNSVFGNYIDMVFYYVIRPKIFTFPKWEYSGWAFMGVLSLRLASQSCGRFDLDGSQQPVYFLKLVFPVLQLTFHHAALGGCFELSLYNLRPHELMNLPV